MRAFWNDHLKFISQKQSKNLQKETFMSKIFVFAALFLLTFAVGVTAKKHHQVPREVNQVLEIDAATIQTHVDEFFSLASYWVSDPRNLKDILSFLEQFRELSYMIHLPTLRDTSLNIADDFFNVIEALRNRTRDALLQVSNLQVRDSLLNRVLGSPSVEYYSRTNGRVVDNNPEYPFAIEASQIFLELRKFIIGQIKGLKERSECNLAKLFFAQFSALRPKEISRIQDLYSLYLKAQDLFVNVRFLIYNQKSINFKNF
jgi:hypothetical protein